ncbi:MAG: carbon storage regulator [Planctomycetia bacterium]|jgi:carbon storage regulator CsrA
MKRKQAAVAAVPQDAPKPLKQVKKFRVNVDGNGGLTLGRRAQESVIIRCGDVTIEVVMVEIRGDKARLYFSAPRHVEIVRAELEERPSHDD